MVSIDLVKDEISYLENKLEVELTTFKHYLNVIKNTEDNVKSLISLSKELSEIMNKLEVLRNISERASR